MTEPLPLTPGTPSLWLRRWRVIAPWLVALVTSLGWVAAFPPVGIDELAFVFLIPLVLWTWTLPGWRLLAGVSFGSAFAAWLILFSWLRHFTEHLDTAAWLRVGGAWLAWWSLAAYLALYFLAWALIARWLAPWWVRQKWVGRLVGLFGLAGAWVVLEALRGWLFSGLPWLPMAASQWRTPLLLQVLPLTGAHGLSFLLVLFNLGLAAYVRQIGRQLRTRVSWQERISIEFYTALGLMALSIIQGFGQAAGQRQSERLGEVAFVQPYILPTQRWDDTQDAKTLDTLANLTALAGILQPDLVLWPEAPAPIFFHAQEGADEWAAARASDAQAPVLMGGMVAVRNDSAEEVRQYDTYNAVLLVTPQRGIVGPYYAKRHLVPFGEYTPFAEWLPAIVPAGFSAGDRPMLLNVPLKTGELAVGPLVCYEDIFPGLARDQVRLGAEVLFVANNNSWYGQEGSGEQHAAHAVLRAVETRRPVLRCGNGGWSGWIDEHGQIRHEVRTTDTGSIYFQGVQTSTLIRDPRFHGYQSPYVRYGPWFVWLSLGLAGVAFGWAFMDRRALK